MTTELAIFELPELDSVKNQLTTIRKFQAIVKELLIEDLDYGKVPGAKRPSLLKPGAEKLDKILHLCDTYEELEKVEDWEKPFFYYKVKCRLIIIGTNITVSECIGSCNSMESQYRYRWVLPSQLPPELQNSQDSLPSKRAKTEHGWVTLYRVNNDDIWSLANTILKMAQKRAHIGATLSAARLSDVFTQDVEDLDLVPEDKVIDKPEPKKVEEKPALVKEAEKIGAIVQKTEEVAIHNRQELTQAMIRERVTTQELLQATGKQSISDITDFQDAWNKVMQARTNKEA